MRSSTVLPTPLVSTPAVSLANVIGFFSTIYLCLVGPTWIFPSQSESGNWCCYAHMECAGVFVLDGSNRNYGVHHCICADCCDFHWRKKKRQSQACAVCVFVVG